MELKYIVKRNGAREKWNGSRIEKAIRKCFESCGSTTLLVEKLAELAIKKVVGLGEPEVHIEKVQDLVETTLMEQGLFKEAATYIKYRHMRASVRADMAVFEDTAKQIDSYLDESNWRVAENANMGHSFQGLILNLSGAAQSRYTLEKLPTQIKEAHAKGYMHIHDLSFGLAGYCAGWSLRDLLLEGFNNPGYCSSGPAKHFDAALGQMVNFLGTLQNEWAGAQAFNNVDTYLAPFVRIAAEEIREKDLKKRSKVRREMVMRNMLVIEGDQDAWLQAKDEQDARTYQIDENDLYGYVKQAMQKFVFNLNTTSRWGGQTPFTNLSFDLSAPKHLASEPAIIGGKYHESWLLGDFQMEIEMINRAYVEIMTNGDADSRIFSFPIPTYNVTEGFPWEAEVGGLILDLTAKYGVPYFQNFINSDLDPEDVRSMCCRLQMDLRELKKKTGGLFGAGDLTGSIGVVTLNLPKIAYEADNEDDFIELITVYADLARDQLELKRKMLNGYNEAGFYPFTRRYLKNGYKGHFSTIGLLGGHEACLNLLGEGNGIETDNGVKLMKRVLNHLRKLTAGYQEETGNLYNLEATPAEGTSYRLARIDKKQYADIIQAGNGEAYYTNSTALPVGHTTNPIDALLHQNQLQPLYTGGTVFHTFIGEALPDRESVKNYILKAFTKTKIPYVSVTPTFSICPEHGYLLGEHHECPTCGDEAEVWTRIVGYYRPVSRWNKGKQAEYCDRTMFDVEAEKVA